MADIIAVRSPTEHALAEAFRTSRDMLPGNDAARAEREANFAAFEKAGLPHRRVEAWRYTDLRTLMRDAKPLAPMPDAKALDAARSAGALLRGMAHLKLVIVDGVFAPTLSDVALLPTGVTVRSLAEALADEGLGTLDEIAAGNPAISLNAALMSDGVVVEVAAGTEVELPLHIVTVHTGEADQAVYTRSRVSVGAGATLTLVETYEGPAARANQTNAVLELSVGDGARVERIAAQTEGLGALHLHSIVARIGAEATLRSFALVAGSAVARNQVYTTYAGENATGELNGATLLGGRRHADTTLVVDHAVPGGTSRETYHAVIGDQARSAFQGKIMVRPHAQKTDGKMMSRALLLSDEAEADNKPELEIFADDVACGHGATCGALNDELLFYCMARGLPRPEAEAILLEAFIGEAVESVAHEGVRENLMGLAREWLATRA